MSDLIAFVKARLDEKAATAHYAGPARIAWLTLRGDNGQLAYTTVAADNGGDMDHWCADGRAITEAASVRVIYDPAAALREAEADLMLVREYERVLDRRRIYDAHSRALPHRTPFTAPGWPTAFDLQREVYYLDTAEPVLHGLLLARAATWIAHPDYDPAWTREAAKSLAPG